MTINHHPTVETLTELANGRLDASRTIVVEAHLECCDACRSQLRIMREVGGALLAEAGPVPMSHGALDQALKQIAAIEMVGEQLELDAGRDERGRIEDGEFELPAAIRQHRLGKWKWIGPGIHRRMIDIGDDESARVFLLRAAPGTRMPDHSHTGTELTLVLSGAFKHCGGHFGPGDFDDADESVEHQPVVEQGEVCICLVAMQGNLKLSGVVGRLMQPLVRI